MPKKIIIDESMLKKIVFNEMINENLSNDKDLENKIKDFIKNNSDIKKEIEKKTKDIVASCINNLFKTLWQRRNFYEDEIRK